MQRLHAEGISHPVRRLKPLTHGSKWCIRRTVADRREQRRCRPLLRAERPRIVRRVDLLAAAMMHRNFCPTPASRCGGRGGEGNSFIPMH